LIDIDHYFWYVFTFKEWNPLAALRWHKKHHTKWVLVGQKERAKFKKGVFIFHSILLVTLLGILSTLNLFFFSIFLGVLVHIIADLIALVYYHEPLYIKLCPYLVMRRNKNKESFKKL